MYLNDILIFFKNRESHVQHIREVLKRLRTNDLFASFQKCFFFKHEIDYLEFIINEDDITMNSSRINIIMSWSMIKFFKNIQIFLNFVNFYRRFIVRFSQLSAFLSDMLKKMQAKIKKKIFFAHWKSNANFWLISRRFSICFHSDTFRFEISYQIENERVRLWNRRHYLAIAVEWAVTIRCVFLAKDDSRRNELRNARSKIANHRRML
jgi:hypothetical protein